MGVTRGSLEALLEIDLAFFVCCRATNRNNFVIDTGRMSYKLGYPKTGTRQTIPGNTE